MRPLIDLHSHILPGLDDGARSIEEARELARSAAREGTTVIAATPHVRADYPTTAEEMERGVAALRADFEEQEIPIRVSHGGEVDAGLLWQLPRDALLRFTLAQTGRYLLLEVPYRASPLSLVGAVARLRELGITAVLAHPERNPVVQDRPETLERLLEAGALVQVTAASLSGEFGRASQLAADKLLARARVHVVASDAHAPHLGRAGLGAAADAIADPDLRRYLLEDAPAKILAGDDVPAFDTRTIADPDGAPEDFRATT